MPFRKAFAAIVATCALLAVAIAPTAAFAAPPDPMARGTYSKTVLFTVSTNSP